MDKAEVEVQGTGLVTTSNPDGSFRLNGVPAGTHTVVVSYAGLEPAQQSVAVQPNATTVADFSLASDIIKLTEFKVAGVREGNAYAVQQQRMSPSARLVISADALGNVADANPAEFLKNLPGMSMEYTGIEPRRVSVRGLEPNSVQVLLNGNQVASAGSSSLDRAYEFDQTSIDSIEAMDVTLAGRPDMPANTIAGTINILTRNAFMQKGRRLNATFTLSGNTQFSLFKKSAGPRPEGAYKTLPGFSVAFSDTFMKGRLGVSASASLVQNYAYGFTAVPSYYLPGPPPSATSGDQRFTGPTAASEEFYLRENSTGLISKYTMENATQFTRRAGASLNFDYKLSDTSTVFLRTMANDYHYEFFNRTLAFNVATASNVANKLRPGASTEHVSVVTTDNNTYAEQTFGAGVKLQNGWSVNLGANHTIDEWQVNYDAWLTRATAHYKFPDFFGSVNVRLPNITFDLDKDPNSSVTRVTQTSGPDAYSLSSGYRPQGTVNANLRSSTDEFVGAKGSVRRAFDWKIPVTLEAGLFGQKQERIAGNNRLDWNWSGVTNVEQFSGDLPPEVGFGQRAPDLWISSFKLFDYFQQHPELFPRVPNGTTSAETNAFLNKRRGEETITATYIMATVKYGEFDVLAGARFEHTEDTVSGGLRKVDTGALEVAEISKSYSPWPFKDIHVTYHPTKKLQMRASYTEAQGRPNLTDMVPTVTQGGTATSPRFTVANPKLKPMRSQNLDAAVEYYFKGTNYLSAGWFRKNIKDYIVQNTSDLTYDIPEYGIFLSNYSGIPEIVTRFNSPKVTINGVELSARYTLPYIPKAIGEFEVWGNYTHLYEVEALRQSFTGKGLVPADYIPNIAPWSWNVGLSYTGLGGKLRINTKTNGVADRWRNYNQNRDQVNDRVVTDGDVSYQLTKTFKLKFGMKNILAIEEGQTLAGRESRTGNGGPRAYNLSIEGNF